MTTSAAELVAIPVNATLWPAPLAWFFGVWLFCLGATFGSFLNVVIYRLPRGMNIAHPPSSCPRCGMRIRWFDNIPILSWLLLRGRCRKCRASISVRYPLVEALVGGVFVALAAGGLFRGWANLPAAGLQAAEGGADAWLAYVHFASLLCTLIPAALIRGDRLRLPWLLLVPAAVVGLLLPHLAPQAQPVAAWLTLAAGSPVATVITSLVGVVGGAACALLAAPLVLARGRPLRSLLENVAWLALAGLFLGWQAALGVTAVSMLVWIPVQLISRPLKAGRCVPWPGVWAVAALAWILCWETLVTRALIFAPEQPWYTITATVPVILGGSLLAAAIAPPHLIQQSPQ